MNDQTSAALLALGNCELVPINSQTTAMYHRASGAFQIIAADVARALGQCLTFDTLDNHAMAIRDAIPGLSGNEQAIKSTIGQLAESGFLLSADDTISDWNIPGPAEPLARTRMFIITCDRPKALQRLLESLAELKGLTRHEAFIVVDDSRSDENVALNREQVEVFNTRSAQTAVHFTPDDRRQLLDKLCAELPEHQNGIRFLLDREAHPELKSYGAARNVCLLLSVGSRALVMDDDILPYCLKSPSDYERPIVRGGAESHFRFFASLESVLNNIDAQGENALHAMADVLGSSLGDLPGKIGLSGFESVDLTGAPGVIVDQMGRKSRILITQCGTMGDPGTEGLGWIHQLDANSLASLASGLRGPDGTLLERSAWRGVAAPTVAKMASMSQLTGIDNSAFMPPYFPYFRGEDVLFGACVDYLHDDGLVFEHDWCIAHLPAEARAPIDLKADAIVGSGSLGDMARRITSELPQHTSPDPQARLQWIAQFCRAEASRSDAVLAGDYRLLQVRRYGELLNATQMLSGLLPNTEAMRDFGTRCIDVGRDGIQREWTAEVIDSGGTTDAAQVFSRYREMLDGYASALDAWPAVREAAAKVSPTDRQ